MRAIAVIATLVALWAAPALAAEKAAIVRGADLKDRPFMDAATVQSVAANAPVTVLVRQGGWAQVDAAGAKGWVRVLNLRLEGAQEHPAGGGGLSSAAALFHTGSSGKTVTTGVKGMNEADIRNAVPDAAQLAQLDALAPNAGEARANAVQSGLHETTLAYLKKGKDR